MPIVYTLHNLEKGWRLSEVSDYPLSGEGITDSIESALAHAGRIVTVSERYAEELKSGITQHQGYLPAIERNASRLSGISNGLEREFNPDDLYRRDLIPHPFNAQDLSGKAKCHLYLQRLLGFPEGANIPIILWSQRLVESKGADVFAAAIGNQVIRDAKIQIIIFGRGRPDIEEWMKGKAQRFTDHIRFIPFTNRNAYYEPLFIAGSDLVVAPSMEEPFGFLPRKAARLGTLTWIRPVGGMAQIGVVDGQNGYIIPEAVEGKSMERLMAEKLVEILRVFQEDRPAWEAMQKRAMEAATYSWDESAEKYLEIFNELLAANS